MNTRKSFVGRSVTRLEDRPLVAGAGRFAADMSFPHQLHMRVVRSAYANGIITAIDAAAARALAGVHAVWTAADIADIPPIDVRLTRVEGLEPYRQPVLACTQVRYVGEPVAVVFAEDAYVAEDAADLVAVAVEELPPLLDPLAPPGEPSRPLDRARDHPQGLRRRRRRLRAGAYSGRARSHGRPPFRRAAGDARGGGALRHRPRRAGTARRRQGAALEPRPDRPHARPRAVLRASLRRPCRRRLRRAWRALPGGRAGLPGGAAAAPPGEMDRGSPRASDRRQSFARTAPPGARRRRPRWPPVGDRRRVLPRPGRLCAHAWRDGAGPRRRHAAGTLPRARLPRPRPCAADQQDPLRHLSGARPLRKHLRARAAHRRGGGEARPRSGRGASPQPHHRGGNALCAPARHPWHRGGVRFRRLWAAARQGARRRQLGRAAAAFAQRRGAGEAVGAGVALFVEKSGLGPFDGVRVSVDASGAVEVVTGAASVGQGVETAIAQICADALGVDYARVRVTHGQTDRIDFGMGAFASRVTVMTGEARRRAAAELRGRAIDMAAELLQAPAATLDVIDGEVVRTDVRGGPSVALGAVAQALGPASRLRGARSPGLAAEGWFHTDHMNYPYGVHIAVVRVDRETGGVTVSVRYLVAYDIGRAVNPMLVEGQIAGGLVQGLGGALLEEFIHDARGEPLGVTFADYLMPTVRETPPVDVVITEDAPSPLNPLGLKGAGEGGVNAVGAAIAAAIDDALAMPGTITALPVTPQRLKRLLGQAP